MHQFSQCTITHYSMWWRQLNRTQLVFDGYLNLQNSNLKSATSPIRTTRMTMAFAYAADRESKCRVYRDIESLIHPYHCKWCCMVQWPWAASLAYTAEVFEVMNLEGEKFTWLKRIFITLSTWSRISRDCQRRLWLVCRPLQGGCWERERNYRSTLQDSSSGWYKDQMGVNDYR